MRKDAISSHEHMRIVSVLHILVQAEILHSFLQQFIVLLEFHFVVHEKPMVLILIVDRLVELRHDWEAINVYIMFNKSVNNTI